MHDLLKMGPTSANCSPARFLFLRTKEAKQKLAPALSSGNLDKTMAAPVTAIVAYDPKFYEKLPKLFPHNPDATSWFTSNDSLAATTAFRNGTLQGAYLILAARAVGLDTGRDVRLRQCHGGRAVPRRPRLAVELPVQYRPWRSGRAVPALAAPRLRRSLRAAVGQVLARLPDVGRACRISGPLDAALARCAAAVVVDQQVAAARQADAAQGHAALLPVMAGRAG